MSHALSAGVALHMCFCLFMLPVLYCVPLCLCVCVRAVRAPTKFGRRQSALSLCLSSSSSSSFHRRHAGHFGIFDVCVCVCTPRQYKLTEEKKMLETYTQTVYRIHIYVHIAQLCKGNYTQITCMWRVRISNATNDSGGEKRWDDEQQKKNTHTQIPNENTQTVRVSQWAWWSLIKCA